MSRRLILSVTSSVSFDPSKLRDGAMKGPGKYVKASLKNAPKSDANPRQNK
ncbi:hypothetical protein RHMOL_Rhmol13G0296800 [Rhododendron molle]|uniref:Uncharacterized protein n=1 Tax=Rhododendron molle TaxID=49168 RepID=A0ACC0LD73_RHOML|nr:hypothetical protein RHMOL_Rhmol13G0296800 [Rhododendron molle]